MRDFTPSSGLILIAPLNQAQGLSGISEPEKNRKGKVVAVGEDTRFTSGDIMKAPCKVGDVVYHAYQYEGDVVLKGIKYKIVRFEGILGVYGK